jgi:hypothetical protein
MLAATLFSSPTPGGDAAVPAHGVMLKIAAAP